MRRFAATVLTLCLLGVGSSFFAVPLALAQPTPTINYQGKLTTPTGVAVADGQYTMEFKLYTVSSGGVAIWTETRNGGNQVTINNGLFSVMLGSVTSLTSVNFNQPLYLGVKVAADSEMTPRKAIGTVPSAFEAKQLGGVASSSFLRSDQADVAGSLLTFNGGLISNSSSTLARLSFTNATGTSLFIGGDRITDFVGDGLSLSGTTLQATLGGSVQAGEIANGDHGFFSYASGVASLDTSGLTSANLSAALTDETGTGSVVLGTSPTFTTNVNFGTAGVRLSDDGDGAITFLGLGNGSDENLTMNLDDTANEAVFTSSTGLNRLTFTNIGLDVSSSTQGYYLSGLRFMWRGSNGSTFLGQDAGNNNISAFTSNTFLGAFSSSNRLSGNDNTMVGAFSGYSSNGSFNTYVGDEAGGNLNSTSSTIIGAGAFRNADFISNPFIAINNTALGYNAGNGAQTGSDNNILIGYRAADNLTTGNNNIIIGYDIDNVTATADNRLNIGNLIFGTGLDGTGTTLASGNIGIGTTSPSSKLTVSGDLRVTGAFRDTSGDAGASGQVLLSTLTGTNWVATSSLGISSGSSFSNSAQLAALLSDETGFSSGALSVFSISPVITGTADFVAGDYSSTLTMSGSAANIALGSNYLSGDGGDEGIFIDANGNVGIGTTTPTDLLTLGSATNARIVIDADTNNNSPIEDALITFYQDGRTARGDIGLAPSNGVALGVVTSGAFEDALILGSRGGGSGKIQFATENLVRMTIDNVGNIGIGDTTPDYSFDVAGTSGFDGLMTMTGTVANIALGSNWLSGDGADEGIFVDGNGRVGIGTNIIGAMLTLSSVQTSGSYFQTNNTSAITLAGSLTGFDLNLSANITATNQSVTGYSAILPAVSNSTTQTYRGVQVAGGDITTTGGISTFTGAFVTNPNLTQTAGTARADGLTVTTGTNTTGGTQTAFNVIGQGVGTGNLYGLNFANITAGAGTERAINIGSGWDNPIYSDSTTLSYFRGNLGLGHSNVTGGIDAINIFRETGESANILIRKGDSSGSGGLIGQRSRGSITSPTSLSAGDVIFGMYGDGFAGGYGSYNTAIEFVATENFSAGVEGTAITFKTIPNGGGSLTERLRIDNNGNVGIGTTSPYAKLSVVGNSAFTGQVNLAGTAANIALGSNFLSGDGGDEGIYIDGDGDVTVGASDANTYKLRVVGSTFTQLVNFTSGTVGGASHFNFQIHDDAGAPTTYNLNADNSASGYARLTTEDGTYRSAMMLADASGTGFTAFGVGLSNNSGSTWSPGFVLQQSGNFGIGTSTPSQMLTVGATAGSQFLVSSAGVITSSNNITPNSVKSAGQTDEYCLTYESTGTTFEWQTCGGGGGLTSADIDTSAELQGIVTDETGNASGGGFLVFSSSPTFLTQITTPIVYGGTTASSQLILRSTLGAGTTDDIIMGIGTAGAIQAFRIDNENDSVMLGEGAGASFTSNTNFNVAFGYNAGGASSNSNADNNNYIGTSAGASNTGNYNNLFGASAGFNNTGNNNNFLGQGAGESNTGADNNIFGYYAGSSNTGNYNNIFGFNAGQTNTGDYNNYLGRAAGYFNNGDFNEFIGYQAGFYLRSTSTVAIGAQALAGSHFTDYISLNNVALGYRAGYASNDGSGQNILIGYQAADNLTTGNNNIIIGYDIDNVTATADNRLNIGNLLFGSGINGTGTTLSTGKIGIGTTTPSSKLDIFGATRVLDDGFANTPTTGQGVELFHWNGNYGAIAAINRTTNTNMGMKVFGSSVTLGVNATAGSFNSIIDATTEGALIQGTPTTQQILTVLGTNPQGLFFESSTEFLRTGVGETAGTSVIGWDDADSLRLGVYDSHTDTSLTDLMTILSTGNVGIGDATPTDGKLDILATAGVGATRGINLTVNDVTATANAVYGSQTTLNDTGVVTTGFDDTFGNSISINRTGATGGTLYTVGQYINVYNEFSSGAGTADAIGLDIDVIGSAVGASTAYGARVDVSGADINYSGIFTGGNFGIGDTTPTSLFTVGNGDLFTINTSGVITSSNNLTPNSILSTGQTDEYCLTYEGTGTTFEWQTCGSGGSLFTDGGANTYLTATGDNLSIGGTGGSARLNVYGNIDVASPAANISFMGTRMLYGSTTNDSITFGENAGSSFATTALYNTAIGFGAGQNVTTSDENIYIGYQAGRNGNGLTSVTAVGYEAGYEATGINNAFMGRFAGYSSDGRDNVIMGTEAGAYVNGDYSVVMGYRAAYNAATTTDFSNIIGYNAGYSANGTNNNLIGAFAGDNLVGSSNTAIGFSAGSTAVGGGNVYIGEYAGLGITGSFNNSIGQNAGRDSDGSNNNYYGGEAGRYISGDNNSLFGAYAMTGGVGAYTGSDNVAFGYGAGFNAQGDADGNVLLGSFAGESLTTGDRNIIIGQNIDPASNTGNNQLNIGNLIFGTGLDGTNTTLSSGNIGIGTTSPMSKFTVSGDVRVTGAFKDSSGDTGLNGQLLQSTLTGTNWVATSSLGITGSTAIGGAITGGANPGNILYVGASSVLAQDNNFYYDYINGRLGLGTQGPLAKLDIILNSSSTAAGIELGSFITVIDSGVVTTGYDETNGNVISVSRSNATGGSIVNYGQKIEVIGDTGGTSLNYGIYTSVSGADTNYAGIFTGGNVGIGDTTPDAILDLYSTQTSGTLIGYANDAGVTLAGALTGMDLNLSTNYTATGQSVTGYLVTLPTVTNSSLSTLAYRGLTVTGNTLIQQTAAGNSTFTGAFITNSNISLPGGGGSVTANGVSVTTGSVTTGGTQQGFNVFGQGVTAGTLNALNITAITAGAGTENAINIGTGYDNILNSGVFTIAGTGATTIRPLATFTTGTGISYAAAGATTLSGAYTGISLDLRTSFTATGQSITGQAITIANVANTAAGPFNYTGTNIGTSGATLTQTTTGTSNWIGSNILTPNITQNAGTTVNSFGLQVTTGSITTAGTQSALNVAATGVAAGTLNGLNVSNITAAGGAENAINIGTGWDNILNTTPFDILGNGSTVIAPINTFTTGTGISYAAGGVTTLTGAYTGMNLNLNTNYTATGQSVTGYSVTTPTVSNTAVSTLNYRGITVTGSTLTRPSGAGTDTFTGAFITNSNLSQTAGTLSSNGVSVTTGTNTNGGTQQGFNVIGQGVSVGTLNAINIANITGNTGTENAINIGTGYDKILESTPFDIAATGFTTINPLNTVTTGNAITLSYGVGVTLTGQYTGFSQDYTNFFTATGQNVTGDSVILPAVTNTGASSYTYRGFNVAGGALVQNTAAGATRYIGFNSTNANLTQTTGTASAYGAFVTTGSNTTNGAQYGYHVEAAGVGAGTLYGLSLSNITAGAGTEQGIIIGTGWDVGIVSNSRITVASDIASNYAATFFNDGNATTRFGIQVQAGLDDNTAAGPSTLIQFADGDGTSIGSISFGSSVVAYNTTSDRRLKENIVDTNLGIDALMQLQVRDYNWKADADHSTLTQGFVAQELFEVYPQAVTVPTNPANYWMVDYSKLTPLIISAVQDQQAQINTLFTGSDSPFNLSEKYRTLDGAVEAGHIVSLIEDESATIKRAGRGETILGVVSNEPGLLLNQSVVDGSPVAVSGHVAVKVNMEGGSINVGDAITLSSVRGVGTKATTTSDSIGIALEATSTPGTLKVHVRNQTYFSQSNQASLAQLFSTPANAEDENDTLWSRLSTLASNFVNGVLTIAGVKTEELCVGSVCVDEEVFLQMVENAGATPQPSNGGGGSPELEPTPEPSPTPEPTPEEPPTVEPAPAPEPASEPMPAP